MRVRIVCYENVNAWILGKFALKLNECLSSIGIQADIDKQSDPTADINHHIIYYYYDGQVSTNDTLMITHIDNLEKLHRLKKQLVNAKMGICMSRETMDKLKNCGIPRNKLSYINPAHDGVIIPRPKTIGITSRVQSDGRKREHFLSKLAMDINPNMFSFKIMGDGWDNQVDELRKNGFQVEYTNNFEYNQYVELLSSLDYYLYMGQDEGQMGFIDAVTAGVETIVTPQGYHLDAEGGINYSFTTYNELVNIFRELTDKRLKLINSVSRWNWENYTLKHVEIWEYILSKDKLNINQPKRDYYDGINSIEKFDNFENKGIVKRSNNNMAIKLQWFYNNYKHRYYNWKARKSKQ